MRLDTELEAQLRSRGLSRAARYEREVPVGPERVWENVFDWEHLPWLHASSYASIELLARGAWGWKARIGARHGEATRSLIVELVAERSRGRYVAKTLEGPGTGTEIWTQLTAVPPGRTRVELEFWIPQSDPARLHAIGAALVELYKRLWDEDESMMARRTMELSLANRVQRRTTRGLGPLHELRPQLPLCVDVAERSFRIVEVDGQLFAHSTRCPHMLGPLDCAAIDAGRVRCPWHGYRFDVRTGASADGNGLVLETAAIEIDPLTSEVMLHLEARGTARRDSGG